MEKRSYYSHHLHVVSSPREPYRRRLAKRLSFTLPCTWLLLLISYILFDVTSTAIWLGGYVFASIVSIIFAWWKER